MSLLDKFKHTVPIHYDLPYTDSLHEELLNEFRILHLVYHRNKNQHRVAKWWSSFDKIHRHLRKILLIIEDINEILLNRYLTLIIWNKNKKTFYKAKELPLQKRIKIKHKKSKIFIHNKLTDNQGINLINKKLSLLEKEIHFIIKNCIPSAYWLFMGVIELGQFSNLGFVLIGLTAKILSLLKKFDIKSSSISTIQSIPDDVIPDVGIPDDIIPDVGIPVDISLDKPTSNIFTKPKKKKKIKKKSKNIMDDIFG